MNLQLMGAVENRDGEALAKMAGGSYQPDKVLNSEAEGLVDSLFRQLKQIFPASTQTNLRTDADEKTAKRQWIAAFAENGIITREQLSAGVRHARASNSPFWPSPGQFIKWCKDSSVVLGITIDDVMKEFHRYSREKSLHAGGPANFPWSRDVMYWIVTETRTQMFRRQLGDAEVEKYAAKKLDEWANKVAAGEKIPSPIIAIESKKEVIQTCHNPDAKDHEFRYMPNAAVLGAMTPAQWLMQEYKRRKSAGMV